MKVTFDTSDIHIPLDVFMQLLSFHVYNPITRKTLERGCKIGMLEYTGSLQDPKTIGITSQGCAYVERILSIDNNGNDVTELATQLRELFPKGRKAGTNYMWRDSLPMIVQKLNALKKKCKDDGISFTNEEAIDATKRYIDSFNGDYTYMQLLKYFILKRDLSKGEETSQLLSFIQNEDASTDNSSWMDVVR